MNHHFRQQGWGFIGRSFVLAIVAPSIGAVLACLSVGMIRPIPIVALVIGGVVILYLWPIVLAFGIWQAWFLPRACIHLFIYGFAACIAGVIASWRFQTARPFDFYHESDGSMPGWEPVQLISLTTIISCTTALVSVALPLAIRWYREQRFSNTEQGGGGNALEPPSVSSTAPTTSRATP